MLTALVALALVPDRLEIMVGDMRRIALVENAGPSPRPTVVVLHGGMGSAEQMRQTAGFGSIATREGFMVVYPQGTEFSEGRHAWNTGYLARRQVGTADDLTFLDRLLQTLVREGRANPQRIYMTGGSNGGMMTLVYASQRARRLAAIVPVVAAMFTFDKMPETPLPVLFIQGAKDDEVPFEGGFSRNPLVSRAQQAPYKPFEETVQFWVRANGAVSPPKVAKSGSLTTTTYEAGKNGATVQTIVDAEGGHGWPGRARTREGGKPVGVQGAEEVWKFFRDKQRDFPVISR